MLERLSSPDTETRGWATHVLCELPYSEAIAPLLLRLRDVDLSTRVSAAHALAAVARMYPEEVRGGVLGLARSVDPIDRAAAMRVMGELREPSLVPELVRALADGDEAVVASAHASLVLVTRQDFGLDARPWLRWWELNASRHRIEWLIDALTHEVGEIRRAAGEELRASSKEYFGYASRSAGPRSRALAAALPRLVGDRRARAVPAKVICPHPPAWLAMTTSPPPQESDRWSHFSPPAALNPTPLAPRPTSGAGGT